MGYKLDLRHPKTFNEKLQWLKLHDRKPEYTIMVDKYEAKKYVASIIGEEYIIPTYGVWERFDDIDFDKLPDQFVLKCTHDSGGLIICRDKSQFDFSSAKMKLTNCLRNDYYKHSREWPYKNVKPRIIAEKYMEDAETGELRDYKFFCFNGLAKCCAVHFDRFKSHHANYFDAEGNLLPLGTIKSPPDFEKSIIIPNEFCQMKDFAELLAKENDFLRVDFYDVNGKVFFGELTFYPSSGCHRFIDEKYDELLGKWLKLPDEMGGL